MIIKIENENLIAQVKSAGAELNRVYCKDKKKEYLWNGDEKIWYGQSPILFPIVGKLLDDKYRYNGEEYTLEKHGFARKREFEVVSQTENSVTFVQRDDENTYKAYPFKFELLVKFELANKNIKVTHTIKNMDEKEMLFSLGAHPGFNCEIGDSLIFDENETLVTERIDENALIAVYDEPLLDNAKEIVITEDIFKTDALILSGFKSKGITLKSKKDGELLHFNFGNTPFLGIWAKPGAPYVCIEPWFGVNDGYDKKDDLSQKRGIQTLAIGGQFQYSWSAEIK